MRQDSKNKKRKRKPTVKWKYEIVQADGHLDIEGLAEILARMFMDSKYYRNHPYEKAAPSRKEKKHHRE